MNLRFALLRTHQGKLVIAKAHELIARERSLASGRLGIDTGRMQVRSANGSDWPRAQTRLI